jgi:tetratricopeptide (TPR) repeat protein
MDLVTSRRPRHELRAKRWLYAAYVAVVVAYAIALALVFRGRNIVLVAPVFWGVDTGPRVLTALSIIPHYVRLLLFPAELSSDYSPRIINLAESVTSLVAAGLVLVVMAIAAIAASWRRAPVLAFALLWIVISLAPVSNLLFATGIALAERTLYLPSVGVALGAAYLLEKLAEQRMRLAALVATGAVLALAARTWTRNATWRDSQTWLNTLLVDHPESYKARFYYAQLLAALGKLPEADLEYTRARMLFQRDPYLYQSASDVAMRLHDYPRALALIDTAVAYHPELATAHIKRADLRLALGDAAGARESANRIRTLRADSATRVGAAVVEGMALQRLGKTHDAILLYRDEARRFPGAWQLHVGLADALLTTGDTLAAREAARRAIEAAQAAARVLAADSAGVAAAHSVSRRAAGAGN